MTWSILAVDPNSGALAAAAATQAFACGSFVPFVRAGVGAVATQSITNRYLGPATLDGLARGLSPKLALASALAGDVGKHIRQVHVVSPSGDHSAWTGANCVEWCGALGAQGVSVAGNMLVSERVAAATLQGFNADPAAELPERLMAALEAGEAAGGDRRGRRSAAMVMASSEDFPDLSLRVDDHADPLSELSRLLEIWRTERAPSLIHSPSKSNPAGRCDLEEIESEWIARGLEIRFRRAPQTQG